MQLTEELKTALSTANRVLILTGAGMSAESGVATFRDAQTGLWRKFRPQKLATPQAFADNPARVWDWYQMRRAKVAKVKPHPGHTALVKLEQHYASFSLVTQNVDGLHQAAGSRQVIELHGNIRHSICSKTHKPIDEAWLKNSTDRPPPSPHHPQGFARPAVVWFGEALPVENLKRATAAAVNCDLCLSIGTSTVVEPAASLPCLALENGAIVIEINPVPTALSAKAQFCLQEVASVALTTIAAVVTDNDDSR